jgi:hypothetical protein
MTDFERDLWHLYLRYQGRGEKEADLARSMYELAAAVVRSQDSNQRANTYETIPGGGGGMRK